MSPKEHEATEQKAIQDKTGKAQEQEQEEKQEKEKELTQDELIAAALQALESPLPETAQGRAGPPATPGRPLQAPSHQPFEEGQEQEEDEVQDEGQDEGQEVCPASPTLAELDASRRPKAKTVCEDCPNSVWFTSAAEVKCYCRVMFLVTWSSHAPNQITGCDGLYLGQEP